MPAAYSSSTGFLQRATIAAGPILALVVALFSFSANATTPAPGVGQFKVCLKQNMSGFVDLSSGDRATQTAWALHAVYAELKLGFSTVRSWGPVDKEDGCFLANGSGSASYTVSVATTSGTLGGTNTVSSKSSSGIGVITSAVATLGQSQTTYSVTMPSNDTVRVFASLVFFIERAFRGHYSNQNLTSWIGTGGGNNPCDPTSSGDVTAFCRDGNDEPQISLGFMTWGDAHDRKFVVAHEFGHANHWFGGAEFVNNCSLNGAGHRMRGPEWSSCAATEGWAHFYAGDVFNWHDPGTGSVNPQAEYHYVDDGVFSLGDGNGRCPDDIPLDPNTAYPDDSPRKLYLDCFGGGSNPLIGTEMDWARHWWDYHEDTNKGGDERSHAELHEDITGGGGWAIATAYDSMYDSFFGASGGLQSRWAASASWNGVCVGGSTC
jgi:hypothetical protein